MNFLFWMDIYVTTKMQDSDESKLQELHDEVCVLHEEYEAAEQEYKNTPSSCSKANMKNVYDKLEKKRIEFNNMYKDYRRRQK